MALTGNKGEWSEVYVLFKILGDKGVYSGDENLNKIPELFFPLVQVIRKDSSAIGGLHRYTPQDDIVVISNDREIARIPVDVFKSRAIALLNQIKSGLHLNPSFSIPEIEDFMRSFQCMTLKAPSTDKTDIKIIIHDQRTGTNPLLGFSIKSQLGHSSTLLNATSATNVIFEIIGKPFSDGQINNINSINTKSKIKSRISQIHYLGGRLKYYDFASKVFKNNLTMIDSDLPLIISEILRQYYLNDISGLEEITKTLNVENPLKYETSDGQNFYEYKIKHFLTEVALGMTPAVVWNGQYQANGGYLVVKKNGDVLCYHIYSKNDFENYLLANTKLETASTKRHKFSVVERNGDKIFFKLNLQIRFL